MREVSQKTMDKKIIITLLSVFSVVTAIGLVAAVIIRAFFGNAPAALGSSVLESSQIASVETPPSSMISNEIVYESDDGTEFNVPDKLRAVYLKPGQDFLIKTTDSAEMIKEQIDSAMKATVKLGFNSVILYTETSQGVLFSDPVLKVARNDIDIVDYAISSAREHKLYSYIIYPVLLENKDDKNVELTEFTDRTFNNLEKRITDFSKKYAPSAIVLDSYEVSKSDTMEISYQASKSEKSYDDFLREQVTRAMRLARNTVRKNNNKSQVGFVTYGVWANSSINPNGSKTTSNYQSYVDGFADTRDFVLNEKFNFVMVENMMPTDSVKNNFEIIANWWSNLCAESNTVYYNVHASSKLNTNLGEFVSPDQLIRQVSIVSPLKAFGGCAFDSLPALVADYEGSTTLLLKYFDNSLADSLVFSKLIMSTPTKNTFTTYDEKITFSGVTDPNFKTLFNGKNVEISEKGYFSMDVDLKIGANTFKFTHKGKSVTYNITRKVEIIESVTPVGKIEVDGGTKIALSVKAYKGSQVVAKIGNKTIDLVEGKSQESYEEGGASAYVMYEGSFTAPDATFSVQNLGAVSFSAAWQGYNETEKGAVISVFAKPEPPKAQSQAAVQIKVDYAETFPTNILNDKSQPYCYPLPKGTIDYIVGNEISYSDSTGSFKYYKLQSGQRVYSKDITLLGNKEKVNNKISAVNIKYDGRFVNLNIENSWNVPYKYIEEPISYSNKGEYAGVALSSDYKITKITYRIFYTDQIDLSKVLLEDNPIIKNVKCVIKKVTLEGAEISVCDIVLTLKTSGGFFGATPSYDSNKLNIRLNTPAPIQESNNAYGYTLNGATIIIDAGHGGGDPGALGTNPMYPEYVLNDQFRAKVVSILKGIGANVITVDNNTYKTAAQRLKYFKSVNPHIMISIHQNSAGSSARGPLGFYFNSYSQLLAKNVMNSVAANYIPSGSNRSDKFSFNRLSMTREQYYPSMLIECGFISNSAQHTDLIDPQNQEKIAQQIVKGLINYFKSTGSLNYKDIISSSSSDASTSSKVDASTSSASENISSSLSQSETVAFIKERECVFY